MHAALDDALNHIAKCPALQLALDCIYVMLDRPWRIAKMLCDARSGPV
jgi:hypothetical protein